MGTPRLYTSPSRTIIADLAFGAYGEQYQGPVVDNMYTGVGQIVESNDLRTFPARNLSTVEGRWMSPDPAGLGAVDLGNPQSLNRYAYVMGNPFGNIDPTGMDCHEVADGPEECISDPLPIVPCFDFGCRTTNGGPGGYTGSGGQPELPKPPSLPGTKAPANCVAGFMGAGAFAGGGIGGAGGAAGGTLVAPGVGTVGGAVLGTEAGALGGAFVGSGLGAGIGYLVGNVVCNTSNGGSGSDGDKSPDNDTAEQIISKSKQAGVRREFPSQYLNMTLQEIRDQAKIGIPAARKALKLLTDSRFNK